MSTFPLNQSSRDVRVSHQTLASFKDAGLTREAAFRRIRLGSRSTS